MDKEYCLITIYTLGHTLIGLSIGVRNDVLLHGYSSTLKEEYNRFYIDKVVKTFGFLDKSDYDRSHCDIKTSFAIINWPNMFNWSWERDTIYAHTWNYVKYSFDLITNEILTHRHNDLNEPCLSYMPTVKELRSVKGFKSVKQKQCWFCSDWGEDTN